MKILFLGSLCQEENEKELISKSTVGIQSAIIKFQWNLVKGIEANLRKPIDIINKIPVGTYPKYYNQLFFRTSWWSHAEGARDCTLGFINLPLIKQVIIAYKAKQKIKRWIKSNQKEKICIVMYDLLFPYLLALRGIKKKYPEIITCSVVADLPNEYGYEKNDRGIVRFLRNLMGKIQLQEIKKMNCYGLLTEQMRYPLNIGENDYVVIEGIADQDEEYIELKDDKKKIILYTGALNSVYGLDVLLDAFMGIDDENYELWLCGAGNYKSEILNKSAIDSRIKYFGYLTKKEIAELQSKATVLINPRQNIGEYTKYSFPSKIMEYLATGRPVLAYHLDGIPSEYYKYIICPDDNSIEKLREAIIKVCNMPIKDRHELGQAGRKFVLEQKNPTIQCKKLIDLLNEKISDVNYS